MTNLGDTRACFNCGQPRHLARDWTGTASSASTGVGSNKISDGGRGGGQVGTRFGKQNKGGVQSDRQTSQGRVFSLTQRDAQANSEVVTCIIYVFSREAHVIIDPGSTYSFVSLSFSLHVDKPIEPLGYCLSIITPIGECVIIKEVYRGCVLQLGDKELVADLLPLEMLYFNLILGMNWLASYHASVDCYRKEVVFSNFGELEFRFCGDRCASPSYVIFAITARKMLKKGCQEYLAYVVDSELSGPRLEDIPIVCDFVDVFLDELPGLPSDREIEFASDLIHGTAPISSAPYRMAPEELKELKMQLQELLDKGFRPTVSPWDHLCYL
ncbi:hypothetical protein ACSBR1_009131 [Camellia fascicularis]